MKLLLVLSHNGILSRRKSFEAIRSGHVILNGQVHREPSTEVDMSRDRVEYSGRRIEVRKFEYVVFNKPQGCVTTCEGQFDQHTVMDILPPELRHLRPVGRLDKDTEGLLLLTNDGELANRLIHPSFDIDKVYFARVRRKLHPRAVELMEAGLMIEGEKTAPAKVRVIRTDENDSEFEISIHEGRKHQVRLMCQAVGHPVILLRRLAQGPIKLGVMRPSEWRHLTYHEVGALKAIRPVRPGAALMPAERSRSRLKPAFSSDSDQRRFSRTRSWNSEGDVHAPEKLPRFEYPRKSGGRDDSSRGGRDDRSGRERRPYGAGRDSRSSSNREGYYSGSDRSQGERARSERPRASFRGDESRSARPGRDADSRERRPYGAGRDSRSPSNREGYSGSDRGQADRSRSERPRESFGRRDNRPSYSERASGPARERKPFVPREGRPEGRSYPRRDDRGPGQRPAGEFSGRREFKPRRSEGEAKSFSGAGKKMYSSAGKKPFKSFAKPSGKKSFGSFSKGSRSPGKGRV